MDLMIVDKADRYLRQLAPHVAIREGAVLLREAKAEIVALRTGINECYRMLLAEPNTKLALDKAEAMLRELMTPNGGVQAGPGGEAGRHRAWNAGLDMTHNDIWNKRSELDRARREFMAKAMKGFDDAQREERKALRDACGEIGHNWTFSDFGPLGDPWFRCTCCGKTKVEQGV